MMEVLTRLAGVMGSQKGVDMGRPVVGRISCQYSFSHLQHDDRASNEPSRRFHNHKEDCEIFWNRLKVCSAVVTCFMLHL